jgi:hypothetical protein
MESAYGRGEELWRSMHGPLDVALECKLAEAHPDLPVFIMNNVYGGLLINSGYENGTKVDRIAVSLSAIACLRAQPGSESQMYGHLLGLKKPCRDDLWNPEIETQPEKAIKWLGSDEGCTWILKSVDELVEALSGITGRTSVPKHAKL